MAPPSFRTALCSYLVRHHRLLFLLLPLALPCSPAPYTLRVSKLRLSRLLFPICAPSLDISPTLVASTAPRMQHPHHCLHLRSLSRTLGPHCPLPAGSWMPQTTHTQHIPNRTDLLPVCSPSSKSDHQVYNPDTRESPWSLPSTSPSLPGVAGHTIW